MSIRIWVDLRARYVGIERGKVHKWKLHHLSKDYTTKPVPLWYLRSQLHTYKELSLFTLELHYYDFLPCILRLPVQRNPLWLLLLLLLLLWDIRTRDPSQITKRWLLNSLRSEDYTTKPVPLWCLCSQLHTYKALSLFTLELHYYDFLPCILRLPVQRNLLWLLLLLWDIRTRDPSQITKRCLLSAHLLGWWLWQ